jgi:hypothetical protein
MLFYEKMELIQTDLSVVLDCPSLSKGIAKLNIYWNEATPGNEGIGHDKLCLTTVCCKSVS